MSHSIPKPNFIKTILCLANSRKLSGRCIAGQEIGRGTPGAWIRPVSKREHQEVSERERQYVDGGDPSVLDVIDVPLIQPQPHLFQKENWLLDPDFYWQRRTRMDWAGMQSFVEPDGTLWLNNQRSYSGLNDRVAMVQAEALDSSLRLIHVRQLTIRVFRPGEAYNNPKRRVQGKFIHNGTQYWLWVTDPVYERHHLQKPDGEYQLGESCLTISLGEPHEGFAYKLIAAIVERGETE